MFNRRDASDMAELKAELTNDPQGIGYAAPLAIADYTTVEDQLNNAATYAGTVEVATLSGPELQTGVRRQDWRTLAAQDNDGFRMWSSIILMDVVPIRDPEIRQQLNGIWGAASPITEWQTTPPDTFNNLAAMQTRVGPRAEEEWGDGSRIPADVIQDAWENF